MFTNLDYIFNSYMYIWLRKNTSVSVEINLVDGQIDNKGSMLEIYI